MTAPLTPLQDAIRRSLFTQNGLADRLGIDRAQMSRYANGLKIPEPRRLEIAAALGMSPESLERTPGEPEAA